MGSKWRKAKLVLGCIQIPRTLENDEDETPRRVSDFAPHSIISSSPSPVFSSPLTPTPSSSGLRLSRHSSKSSKKTCAICLSTMIPGQGHAIFTAECSHSFHYNCITSNVKHGHRACPVCRATWKEIPFESQTSGPLRRKFRTNSVGVSREDHLMAALQQLPLPLSDTNQNVSSIFHAPEPCIFDDDDLIEQQDTVTEQSVSSTSAESSNSLERVKIRTYPEFPAIPKSSSFDNFTILVHLKAPVAKIDDPGSNFSLGSKNSRAPVDLVTVLDVSGSMAGTKLALLKRAMGFVIQHLGPQDRLSVIAFSSTARRVFPLSRMSDNGRLQALQAVNSLSSNGGTNIAEGLKKGAKVMLERKSKNPVSSIILLSDGQDTYTVAGSAGAQSRTDYKSLLPVFVQQNSGTSFKMPVHAFGFGADHDSVSMHSISEGSGGTFSFIEAESVIQDAFAQCMGGILSVVVQELKVELECLYPGLQLGSIKAGSYPTKLMSDARTGCIQVGDLYAEEERDFLVTVNVPHTSANEMPLLKVSYSYKDPLSKEAVSLNEAEQVKIHRPETTQEKMPVSMEVDRQRNRLKAAEAMSGARTAAERGDLTGAVLILERCQKELLESVSGQAGDPLCVSLGNELKEMQERMSTRQVYEASGRAYVLSGLSSHSWQRATARGDSFSRTNVSQAYQTSSMVDMINRSQTMILGSLSPHPHPPVRPPRSLSERPRPR